MKITEYPSVTDLKDDNVLLLDGPDGTKIMKKSDFVYALFDSIPEMHRQIYRGKSLGSTVTSTQSDNIKNGKFHDIWVGDYWEIGGIKYYVADFDVYYGSRDNTSLSHHLVMWPETSFGTEQFITVDSTGTSNGYGESNIRKALHGSTGNTQAYTAITTAFSSHLLTYSEYLVLGLIKGAIGDMDMTSSVKLYSDCCIELPPLMILDGGSTSAQTKAYAFPEIGVCASSPFALFKFAPGLIRDQKNVSNGFWLRDYDWRLPSQFNVYFSSVNINGDVCDSQHGVRPFFLIA